MKIISWNVNGLRAVYRKGFLDWLIRSRADIVCLQEIKAQKKQLPRKLVKLKHYFPYFNSGRRKGYSGVAVYTKKKPLKIERSLGLEQFDREGRLLRLKFPDFSLLNFYLPHGGRDKGKLGYKLAVYKQLFKYLKKNQQERLILAGDFNIAHQEIDLARPKENKNNIMFTPVERKQVDRLIELGFNDSFRLFHPRSKKYTWWPYAYNARKRNLGWRIDYIFASQKLIMRIKDAFILTKIKGSDHCPIGIKLTIN
jgi:exodeoxyribonuclease-3